MLNRHASLVCHSSKVEHTRLTACPEESAASVQVNTRGLCVSCQSPSKCALHLVLWLWFVQLNVELGAHPGDVFHKWVKDTLVKLPQNLPLVKTWGDLQKRMSLKLPDTQ